MILVAFIPGLAASTDRSHHGRRFVTERLAVTTQLGNPAEAEVDDELNDLTPCQHWHADPQAERAANIRDEVEERIVWLLDDLQYLL